MEFGRNLMLSFAIHATLITVAAGFVGGRDAGLRIPENFVAVTLMKDESVTKPVVPERRKRKDRDGTTPEYPGSRKADLREDHPAMPDKKITAPVSTIEEKRLLPETERPSADISGNNSGTKLSRAARGDGPSLSAISASPTGGAITDDVSGYKANKTGGSNSRAIGEIRSAIEKVKSYPPLAKKRGIEGTVTTEFTISRKGVPEKIKIVRSSGSEILDTAAKNTLLRASPFPFINGSVEVPITFRLKKEE